MRGRFSLILVAVIIIGLGIGAGAGFAQARMGKNQGGNALSSLSQQAPSTNYQADQGQTATGPQAGGQMGNLGTVESKSASGFTLVSQSGKLQVVTNGDTKVAKMSEAKSTELKVGDSVIATGNPQADGSLAASSIQAGSTGGMAGMGGALASRMGQFGQGGQNRGSGSAAQPQQTPRSGMQGLRNSIVNGTIEAIDGSAITVKAQSGSSSKVTVTADTTVSKFSEGSLSDIKDGGTAIVLGERNSAGAIIATSIQLVAAGAMSPGR